MGVIFRLGVLLEPGEFISMIDAGATGWFRGGAAARRFAPSRELFWRFPCPHPLGVGLIRIIQRGKELLPWLSCPHKGAKIGLTAICTAGTTLTHHPHVHCLVPGGGVELDD